MIVELFALTGNPRAVANNKMSYFSNQTPLHQLEISRSEKGQALFYPGEKENAWTKA